MHRASTPCCASVYENHCETHHIACIEAKLHNTSRLLWQYFSVPSYIRSLASCR